MNFNINRAKILESKMKQNIKYNNETNDDLESIKEHVKCSLLSNKLLNEYVCEGMIDTDLEIIGFNINHSPETISQLELLLRKIKMSKGTEYFHEFPTLLSKSTDMILSIKINLNGDVLELVTSIPIVLTDKLIENNVSISKMKSFNKLIDTQISKMTKTLKNDVGDKYMLYYTYLKNLQDCKTNINKYISSQSVMETIAEMQPDIIAYENDTIDDIASEIEDELIDFIFDEPSDDDSDITAMENLYKLSMKYSYALEAKTGVSKPVRHAADKIGKGARAVSNKVVSGAKNAKRTATTINKSFEPLVNLINKTVNDIKETDRKERTERIVTGQFRLKLLNVIKKGIREIIIFTGTKAVVAAAINPVVGAVLAAIAVYATIGMDLKADKKARQMVLKDLENELKIVNEKIEDSRSDENKENKYQLMRIKSKLEHDVERIKYNLDS